MNKTGVTALEQHLLQREPGLIKTACPNSLPCPITEDTTFALVSQQVQPKRLQVVWSCSSTRPATSVLAYCVLFCCGALSHVSRFPASARALAVGLPSDRFLGSVPREMKGKWDCLETSSLGDPLQVFWLSLAPFRFLLLLTPLGCLSVVVVKAESVRILTWLSYTEHLNCEV